MSKIKIKKKIKETLPDGFRRLDGLKCPRCSSYNCGYKEDDRGDFEDHCFACGKTWWVDGPDY